jgi:hypothetical protein
MFVTLELMTMLEDELIVCNGRLPLPLTICVHHKRVRFHQLLVKWKR